MNFYFIVNYAIDFLEYFIKILNKCYLFYDKLIKRLAFRNFY